VYVIYDANQMHRKRHRMLDGALTSMQGNFSPPHGELYEMNRALVIGNGE
jgi:hypothetical protein